MSEQIKYPKVLLCAPQHESKMYCWDKWYERVSSLTYPNYDIFIADNSDTMDNMRYMNTFEGVTAAYTKNRKKGFLELKNDSHKMCVDYAKKHKYDYIFHLETDVFPPIDVIERLMARRRPIIAGVYDLFFGKRRRPMLQMLDESDRTKKAHRDAPFVYSDEITFLNGKVNQVYHAGLGCILIHRDIFNVVNFRVIRGVDMHTDTYFANDCFQYHRDIFVDTTIMCDHYNLTWLSKKGDIS